MSKHTTCPYDEFLLAAYNGYPQIIGGPCCHCDNYDCIHHVTSLDPADAYPDQQPARPEPVEGQAEAKQSVK